jgi:hypothetical protein
MQHNGNRVKLCLKRALDHGLAVGSVCSMSCIHCNKCKNEHIVRELRAGIAQPL